MVVVEEPDPSGGRKEEVNDFRTSRKLQVSFTVLKTKRISLILRKESLGHVKRAWTFNTFMNKVR